MGKNRGDGRVRTTDFINKLKELNFYVKTEVDPLYYHITYSALDIPFAKISKKQTNDVIIHVASLSDAKEPIDIISEYTSTPVKDRLDPLNVRCKLIDGMRIKLTVTNSCDDTGKLEDLFYVKLLGANEEFCFVNYSVNDDTYFVGNKKNTSSFRTRLTLEQTKNIPWVLNQDWDVIPILIEDETI